MISSCWEEMAPKALPLKKMGADITHVNSCSTVLLKIQARCQRIQPHSQQPECAVKPPSILQGLEAPFTLFIGINIYIYIFSYFLYIQYHIYFAKDWISQNTMLALVKACKAKAAKTPRHPLATPASLLRPLLTAQVEVWSRCSLLK